MRYVPPQDILSSSYRLHDPSTTHVHQDCRNQNLLGRVSIYRVSASNSDPHHNLVTIESI